MNSSVRAWLRRSIERLPVLLLVAVALSQVVLARSQGLLAWKGGGFGMFATVDGVELREVRALTRSGERVEVPAPLFREERRARIHPSTRNLEALAQALARERAPLPGARETLEATRVQAIEVWRARFVGDPLHPEEQRLARVVVAQE